MLPAQLVRTILRAALYERQHAAQVPALVAELEDEESALVRMERAEYEERVRTLTFTVAEASARAEAGGADGKQPKRPGTGPTVSETELARKSRQLEVLQDLRAEATMGHTLSEVRLWTASSLSALLLVEPGRSAYLKVRACQP